MYHVSNAKLIHVCGWPRNEVSTAAGCIVGVLGLRSYVCINEH